MILKKFQLDFSKIMNNIIKNKKKGAAFEGELRKALRNLGQFIYTKGVSSKGIDIFGLNGNNVIFIEAKVTDLLQNDFIAASKKQFFSNKEIVVDFTSKTCYNYKNILYFLIIYEENEKFIFYHLNDSEVVYSKSKSSVLKNLENILFKEINNYY